MNHASLESVIEKQKKRYQVMLKMYEIAVDDQMKSISQDKLTEAAQIPKLELNRILRYLSEERLVELVTFATIAITHQGIKEVEDSIEHPNKPTEHFPAVVIQHFYNVQGGVQVNGEGNSQTVSIISGGDNGTE
jgi:hypothetical protein